MNALKIKGRNHIRNQKLYVKKQINVQNIFSKRPCLSINMTFHRYKADFAYRW